MSSEKKVFSLTSPHGPGNVFLSWQKCPGGYLATTGYNQVVTIYNRQGQIHQRIQLQGCCCGIGWDRSGSLLSVINDRSSLINIWDANSGRVQQLDSGLRDPLSLLAWSKTSSLLAVGTTKGNLMVYNHQTSRRIPIVGKHSRKITTGAWSTENLLALGGEDKLLTISNSEGDTIRTAPLRGDPTLIQFSEMKTDERCLGENTVSLLVNKKNLFFFNFNDPDNPIELAFQAKYGNINAYQWYGDGYILLGFSSGYLVAISTHLKEIGQEIFQAKNHRSVLTDLVINAKLNKTASCGDNTVNIHDLSDLREAHSAIVLDEERGLDTLEWSDDGQLLAVASQAGNVHVYLTMLGVIGAANGLKVAHLTSLLEVTISNIADKHQIITLNIDVEPSFMGLGPLHILVGMNNRAWIYATAEKSVSFVRDKEYLGTVNSVHLNSDYVSVLFEGKVQLHLIESESGLDETRESKIFPEDDTESIRITDHAISNDFLVYSTAAGAIYYFLLEDWKQMHNYDHTSGICQIFTDYAARRLVFLDEKADIFVYDPITDEKLPVKGFKGTLKGCLWETSQHEKHIFVLFSDKEIFTYVIHDRHIRGSHVVMVETTNIPHGQVPLAILNGEATLLTSGGNIVSMMLNSHQNETKIQDFSHQELRNTLNRNIALTKFRDAAAICVVLNNKEDWEKLGRTCLECLRVDMAIRVYRQLSDSGMVQSLQRVSATAEDPLLLAGHLAMFIGEFQLAQDLYLRSTSPQSALEMRRDLLHWESALQLADKFMPSEIPFISRQFAQQLEFTGDYPGALTHYEKGLVTDSSAEEHNIICKSGIARTSIRCGDSRRGMSLALEIKNRQLIKDCAQILENRKQLVEAATLYESGGYIEKAALLHIALKNWSKIGQLLPNINSTKIILQYAKAKENVGDFKEAAIAYESAGDPDSQVRILLHKLNAPEQAVQIATKTKSREATKYVAKFFEKLGDNPSAMQFLILAKCTNEAFELARKNSQMEILAQILGEDASTEDYKSLANYFEAEKNLFLSGKFWFFAGSHQKALKLLIKSAQNSADDSEPIQVCIDLVSKVDDPSLTSQLISFLLGEVDGVPKDAKYLFRLYMAKKQYKEASKTAVIIAEEEQNSGNYGRAHNVLFGMMRELKRQDVPVSVEMEKALGLLHSYTLARLFIKRGEHLKAARMLSRVANNISKFSAHKVPILTSAVIECHKSGLKKSAFQFASLLMRPENRPEIDEKYRKKVEAVIRKPVKTEIEESTSACPVCHTEDVPDTNLECYKCRTNLPYCIATGNHITPDDSTVCPSCQFPAIRSQFIKLIEDGEACPMCRTSVDMDQLLAQDNNKKENSQLQN